MKLKKLAAVLLSAATLVTTSFLPGLREVTLLPDIKAEAMIVSDVLMGQTQVNNINYRLYYDGNGSGHYYAVVTSVSSSAATLTIPASVTYQGTNYPIRRIRRKAFFNSNITALYINSNDITIETNAFLNTSKLRSVTILSNVTNLTIDERAFYQSAVQTFSCNSRQCFIDSEAFAESNLYYVEFGNRTNFIYLKNSAFQNTTNLTHVIFNNPDVRLELEERAFYNSHVRYISIPSSVRAIPESCFAFCSNLRSLSLPNTIKSIESNAFSNANLPATMSIPASVTSIAADAFSYVKGVTAYSVDRNNPNYKSTDTGAMFTKDGNVLCAYPTYRSATEYTCRCSRFWPYAISGTKYLKKLNLPNASFDNSNYLRGFTDNTALESLTVKDTETNKSAKDIIITYGALFKNSKLNSFNGMKIITNLGSDAEPVYNSKFKDYIIANFEKNSDRSFIKLYVDQEATWVVEHYTNNAMSSLQKAVRLHQWVCERVIYDPFVARRDKLKAEGIWDSLSPAAQNALPDSDKNHVDASVFMNRRSDGKYYTVCDGYARAYKILMDKAGIPTDYVSGPNITNDKLSGHAWNLVNLDGTWYHVDVTWDDDDYLKGNEYADGIVPDVTDFKLLAKRYNNFLKSDSQFKNNGHGDYAWVSREHPELNWQETVATDSILSTRGDLNSNGICDETDCNRLKTLATGQKANTNEKKLADIDCNGYVNNTDLSLMEEYLKVRWMFPYVAGYMFSKLEVSPE